MLLVGVFDAINNNYGTGMYVHICIYTNPHTRTQKVVFVVFYFVTKSKSRISSSSEDSETSESSE